MLCEYTCQPPAFNINNDPTYNEKGEGRKLEIKDNFNK